MKYAIMMVADQTVAFLGEDGYMTVRPDEARLFDTIEEARESRGDGEWISEIDDVERFRSAPQTWCFGDDDDGECWVCDDIDDPYWGETVE